MVKRICPKCDQVMSSGHFCRYCREWIRHPHIHEVGFYLNERHPADEAACSYHTIEAQNRAAGQNINAAPVREKNLAASKPSMNPMFSAPYPADYNGAKGIKFFIKFIVITYIVLSFILPSAGVFITKFMQYFRRGIF